MKTQMSILLKENLRQQETNKMLKQALNSQKKKTQSLIIDQQSKIDSLQHTLNKQDQTIMTLNDKLETQQQDQEKVNKALQKSFSDQSQNLNLLNVTQLRNHQNQEQLLTKLRGEKDTYFLFRNVFFNIYKMNILFVCLIACEQNSSQTDALT